jgi:hypothetical protein
MRALVLYTARCGGAPSEWGATASGMFQSDRLSTQRWGWPHRVRDNGEDVLRSPYITALSWASVGLMGIRSSRVSSSFFEWCGMEEGREQVA